MNIITPAVANILIIEPIDSMSCRDVFVRSSFVIVVSIYRSFISFIFVLEK